MSASHQAVRGTPPAHPGSSGTPSGGVSAASPAAGIGWAERASWTLAGAALIDWSIQLLSAATSFAWVGVVVVISGGWGLATVLGSWLLRGRARSVENALAWATAAIVVCTLAAWSYVQVRQAPGYGTDELAFDQYAAMLALHGIDPYLRSMAPSFSMFRVSPDGFTYTLAGAPVTALSYPALSFELYLPFLALGWSTQLAVAIDVAAWSVSILLMFALLPRRARAAGLVIGALGVYVSYAVGGITDSLFIPLLIGAAYRWDRFGSCRRSYLGPILLGLAMAVKQTPWLVLPFVLCALIVEGTATRGAAAALRRAALYLALAAVAFTLPNLPFLIQSPAAWWHGILTPIVGQLVPAGQGAIALSLFARLGGGSLQAFTLSAVALLALLLFAYLATYPRLRPATFALPAVALFFASRSYGSYLVALVPAGVVGAFTTAVPTRASPPPGARRRWRRWCMAGAGLAAAAVCASLAWALGARAPLRLRISGLRTTGQLATVEQLTLRVANTTGRVLRPSFTLAEGGGLTTFWLVARGPRALAPGAAATYTLQAPNFPAQPSIQGGFSVLAFTRHPPSLSTSGPYDPGALHVALVPDAVNAPLPTGRALVVLAQLRDRLDRRVRRAGVAVALGQIIYDQSGLQFSEAQVNGRPPGQTPVVAYTDAGGVATFRIVGTAASADPVYFEANLVNDRFFYPYGYSEILPIRFVR